MIPREILKKIRQIELRTNGIVTKTAESGYECLAHTFNSKIIPRLALVLSSGLLLMFTGCRGMGTQSFTAVAPTHAQELEASSQIVLDVTCTLDLARADYNLRENLSMLAPPAKRWKLDTTLQVERVVKGAFDETAVQVHWLRNPTFEQTDVLALPQSSPFGFTNGMRLRIGFDGYSGRRLRNLKMMIQP